MSNSSFLARHCTDFPCGSLTLNSCYLIESQIELDKFWRQVRETLLSEISWIPWPTANTVCTRLRLSSQYPLPLASLSPEPQPVGTLSPTFQTFSTHPHLPSSLLLSSIVLIPHFTLFPHVLWYSALFRACWNVICGISVRPGLRTQDPVRMCLSLGPWEALLHQNHFKRIHEIGMFIPHR